MSAIFYRSAEARWFIPGAEQRETLLVWFTRHGQLPLIEDGQKKIQPASDCAAVKHELWRVDEYLLLPDSNTVGVKQRQGKVEVKALVTGPSAFSLYNVSGRIDEWVKWSFEPSKSIANCLEEELKQSGPWYSVRKERYLQKYSFDSGSPKLVSPKAFPNVGCNIELTLLNVEATTSEWISFGFEAFGSVENVAAILDDIMRQYLSVHGAPPVSLNERDSLSYPVWIAMLQ